MRHHIVDTFADARYAGNPAAVVQAAEFPAEMQQIAHRIGLPTTAFVIPMRAGTYRVRWFTPHKEINLCGHATIASARVLLADSARTRLTFVSDNGVLHAERVADLIAIDLPTAPLTPCEPPPGLLEALGTDAVACAVSSDDILIEVESMAAVRAIDPDFAALARQPYRGHIVTARGHNGVDFASRTFFPALGVDEDQVCVTAHCKLTPYWAQRLGKDRLDTVQLSERGGRLQVWDMGERVRVLGTAVPRGAVHEDLPHLLEETTSWEAVT
ncbi:PhzF family phenazine biosynthesis protein [Nocardia sp. CA-128927]|uniref:PhzF family phenazine biosynthesis protein n=1 Tax=Nocardia sp. CA-128927 TaxID=3239975 RepID=UPI003D951B02